MVTMFMYKRRFFMHMALLNFALLCFAACSLPADSLNVSISDPSSISIPTSRQTLPDEPEVVNDDLAKGDAALWRSDFAVAEVAYIQAQQTTSDFGAVYGRLAFLYALQPEHWDQAIATAQKAVDLARNDAEAWASLALVHALNGHPVQALEAAKQALSLDDTLPLTRLALAQTYLLRNEIDLALQNVGVVLVADPQNVMALLIQAQGYIRMQSFDLGLLSAEQALRAAPDFIPARLVLAQAHQAAWEFPEAQAELTYALSKAPQYLPVRLYQIQALADNGNLSGANVMMARLERDHPNLPSVLYAAGNLTLQQQDYAAALDKFQQVLALDEAFALAHLGLAQAHYGLESCWTAQVSFSQALTLLPHSGAAILGLAQSQECLGDTTTSRENYIRAVTYPWDTPTILQTVADYTARQRDYAGTAVLQRTLLMYRPDTLQLYVDLGYTYLNEGYDLESAARNFRQALALDPQNVAAMIGLGRIYNAHMMPQKAMETFQGALELAPQSFEASLGVGIAYARMERYEKAIAYLEPTLKSTPADPEAYLYLARAYRVQKQYPQAGMALNLFLARQPKSPFMAILSTVAQSHIEKRYWIQQESTAATLQEVLTAVENEQSFPLLLTSLEISRRGRIRELNVVMTFENEVADSNTMHQTIALAAICGAVVTPRVLPPVTGGLNLNIHDKDGTALFTVQIPAAVAQDISDGLIRDYASLVQRVSLSDLRHNIPTSPARISLLAGSAPPNNPPVFPDPMPPELLTLVDNDEDLPHAAVIKATGGPYDDFWHYEVQTPPSSSTIPWSRLEGRWHRVRSATTGQDAMQTYLSKRTSPDLARQIIAGLQTASYVFFQNRTDKRGLLVWQVQWDSSESARRFVAAHRLIYTTRPAYQEVQRNLHSGRRTLRWVNEGHTVHLQQNSAEVWLVFATRPEDAEAVLAFLK